ncbi:hypothetical protein [Ruegeria arenilitoris]|nr:hypothetical protein [Ruegeria arenilitoris]
MVATVYFRRWRVVAADRLTDQRRVAQTPNMRRIFGISPLISGSFSPHQRHTSEKETPMSRIIILIIIAGLGAGAYFYLNQPEPTPAEKLQSAAKEAGEAVGEAATAAQEAASEALSTATQQAGDAASAAVEQAGEAAEQAGQTATDLANQAGDAATDLANQAGDQVAALTAQGQELLNTWVDEGMLSAEQFDYDAMVESVKNSQLSQEIQDQVIKILDGIKEAPETAALKIQELRNLLTQ